MIDLETEFPDLESYQECLDRNLATIRDCLSDIQILYKRMIEGRMYVNDEEVASMLRCDINTIPKRIPYYRVGRRLLYKLSDIKDYIESCKYGVKK